MSDAPSIGGYISHEHLSSLIQQARGEDMGPGGMDVTTHLMVDCQRQTSAEMVSREAGVLAGAVILRDIAHAYDPRIEVQTLLDDGGKLEPGSVIARFNGPLHCILTMERVALNFVTHLSGVATLTARYVEAVKPSGAEICDTRKTLPALRSLQKYAVACGGGRTHRIGLFDAMLIKDNHIAHIPAEELTAAVRSATERAREDFPELRFVQVEADHLEQFEYVLTTGVDRVLLDNMSPEDLREAVAMRDQRMPSVELEASGGITLENVAAVAAAGVNRISVGAITHSAAALDIGLDIE